MSPEPELAELLSAHLDGELSPAEVAEKLGRKAGLIS